MKINKYYIAALTYSIFVGLSFLVTKLVVPHAPSELILSHRFTISLIGYSIFILLSGQKIKLTKKKLLAILPITLFYPLLFFTFQIYGLTYATSSEAGIIFAMVPILVILIGLLMGNYPSRTQLLCIMMSVSGVMIIFTRNLSSLNGNSSGLTLLFLSALSSAVYTILVKKVLKQVTVHELTFVITLIGFLVFNLMFIVGNNHASEVITQYLAPFNNQSYSIGILYLGLFASLVLHFRPTMQFKIFLLHSLVYFQIFQPSLVLLPELSYSMNPWVFNTTSEVHSF